MKFSTLQRGDLFHFLHDHYTYKKIGDTLAMPMCSRMNHVAEIKLNAEVIYVHPSQYSREEEENTPDFESLTWELQCQIEEMRTLD